MRFVRWEMFLSDLSENERTVFLSLARNMVAADDKVTQEEEEMLRDLHDEAGQGLMIDPNDKDIEGLCGQIQSPSAQAKMLLELASIAFVDGEYEDRERELLKRVSGYWCIERLSFLRAEDWGKKRVELAAEAAHLVHEISI